MSAYYNEFDPFAAAWLRNLIAAGMIAAGDVDERSIVEVQPNDLRGYTQCHFFAGIGGWSYALRLAMWPDDRPVWTGSCPCQPFSSAGKQSRQSDERHLWPHWRRLISECRPAIIFGEQVANAIAAGWWDDVAADLEAESYACAAAVLPACAVGAPHRRDRLWFVANAEGKRNSRAKRAGSETARRSTGNDCLQSRGASEDGIVGHTNSAGSQQRDETATHNGHGSATITDGVALGDAESLRSQGGRPESCQERWEAEERHADVSGGAFWANVEWAKCGDGKARPVEPSIPLLAHGIPNRVGLLRGFGNAIVPREAAEFIRAAGGCIA